MVRKRFKAASGNKFNAQKMTAEDGEVFDSRKEYRRYKQLLTLLQAGEIRDLKRQVPYLLVPESREPDSIGPRGGIKKGKVIERPVRYIADFVYEEMYDGDWRQVVEDTKGMRLADYIIKRKLMLYVYGIRIREI